MSPLTRLPARLLALPIKGYRLVFSPWVGWHCRYQPTCSAYALEALETHGALKGGWLAARRIFRCNPWGQCGYDPVPGADATPATRQASCGCEAGDGDHR